MIDAVQTLAEALRTIRVPVSTSDVIAAAQSLEVADLSSRESVRTALAANFVRTAQHRPAFDLLFERIFSHDDDAADSGNFASLEESELRSLLLKAMRSSNPWFQRVLVGELVRRHADIRPGRLTGGAYHVHRVLSSIPPEGLLSDLLSSDEDLTAIASLRSTHLRQHRAEAAVTAFERMVTSEVRAVLNMQSPGENRAAYAPALLVEDADILSSSEQTITEMRRLIAPLARRLAAGTKQRRSARTGSAVDVRRTLRHSRATGGVPILLAFKRRRPTKPRLIVLADVSGSVARFSLFAMQLALAMRESFSTIRTFVFVDTADEITSIMRREGSISRVIAAVNRERLGIRSDGHSDYGNALRSFSEAHGATLDARTTVLVIGDARGNNRESGIDALTQVTRRAQAVHLLVPEPRDLWGVGDSLVTEYSAVCTSVVECRSLRDLGAFVDSLQ